MSNNKYLVILSVIVVFSILAISLTLASNEHSNNHNKKNQTSNETNHSKNETQKENKTMNYGRCISNFTKIKNSCFKEVKEAQKLCVKSARNLTFIDENNVTVPANKTDIKNKTAICKESYKNSLESCKFEFKQFKDTCNQYKCKKNQVFINSTCVKTQ